MCSRVFAIFISFLFSLSAFSQDGSVRVKVFSGSNLDFIFNSISDYKNGVTYPNYTILGIEATEGAPTDRTNWEVTVRAENASLPIPLDGFLHGSNNANTIPLSVIEVRAEPNPVCPLPPAACPVNPDPLGLGWIPLSNVPQLIIDSKALGGGDNIPPTLLTTDTQVNISFRCGFGGTLLGEPADYYADDIWLDINFVP